MIPSKYSCLLAAVVSIGAATISICSAAPNETAKAETPVIKDFVKPTNFKYGEWRSSIIGGGGYVQNVVPCPSNKNRFYSYVDVAGLWRSDDGAKSWRALHGALPGQSGNNEVRGVSVDPRDDNKIVVATGGRWAKRGIFVSDDAGATFTKTLDAQYYGNGNGRSAGFLITRDPKNPDVIVTAAPKDGVLISRDNGQTWTPSADNVKDLFPVDIRYDREDSNRLWMCASGTKYDDKQYVGGFYRSTDGGATWEKLSDDSPSEIVQDPKDASTLFGIFKSEIIRKSSDGGATWEDFSEGLQIKRLEPGKWKESIDKTGYNALGVGPDFILTCNTRDSDFYMLKSGANAWEKVERNAPEVGDWFHKGGWAFGGAAGSITVDPHDAKHWFLTDYFAIYQTFDSGKNWLLTVDGLETTVSHCMLQDPTDPGVMHVGLADVGNFNSVDGGNRFRKGNVPDDKSVKDADAGGGNMKSMDLNAKLPNRMYGVANRNWFVLWRADQVYISIDRGQTWTRSPMIGLPDTGKQPCTTITSDINDPYTVYLTVSGQVKPNGGGVYKSTDGGARWTWMSKGMPTNSWYFPSDIWAHGRQLAASGDGSLIAMSKQGNMVHRFDPATQKWEAVKFNRGGTLWSIAADKLTPGRYFIATRDDGIYRTDDGGLNWKKVFNQSTSYIATDAAVAGRVAGGTKDGVVLSTDAGNTWKMLDKSLPARVEPIPGFAGERLFVATGGSGVFWMPLSPAGEKSIPAKPLVVAAAPIQATLPELVNMNGDAEGDPVPGWEAVAKTGTIQLSRDAEMAKKDRKDVPANAACIKISTGDAPAEGSVYQEWQSTLWNLKTNGAIRARGTFSRINVEVQPFDAANQPLAPIVIREQKPNNAWWDGFGKIVSLPQGTQSARLAVNFEGKGQIWIDDVKIALPEALYPQ
jgi:photosystem II stability/assembly factor-like uncharacterized protein